MGRSGTVVWLGLGAVLLAGLAWRRYRSAKAGPVLLFMSDTHGAAVANRAVAERIRSEPGVSLILHGGDVADLPELWPAWWDGPFDDMPAPVAAASGNHDDEAEFQRRFGVLPRRVRVGADVEVFLLPWGWGSAEAAWFNAAVAESEARHKILVVHRPIFPGQRWAALRPGLDRVGLVLAGHEHVWSDGVFEVGSSRVRQVVVVTGPKQYRCDGTLPRCVEGRRGYLRIRAGSRLEVEEVVL